MKLFDFFFLYRRKMLFFILFLPSVYTRIKHIICSGPGYFPGSSFKLGKAIEAITNGKYLKNVFS